MHLTSISVPANTRDRLITRGAAQHQESSLSSREQLVNKGAAQQLIINRLDRQARSLTSQGLLSREQLVIKRAHRHQDRGLSTRDIADNKHIDRLNNSTHLTRRTHLTSSTHLTSCSTTSRELQCPITGTASPRPQISPPHHGP